MMRKLVSLAACAVSFITVMAGGTYSLNQLLDSARNHNIALRAAHHNIEMAQLQPVG